MTLMVRDIPLAAVRQQIASAVEIMVHLERLPDRSRKVVEIAEIKGMENGEIILNPLYQFDRHKGKLMRINKVIHRKKLERAGIYDEI